MTFRITNGSNVINGNLQIPKARVPTETKMTFSSNTVSHDYLHVTNPQLQQLERHYEHIVPKQYYTEVEAWNESSISESDFLNMYDPTIYDTPEYV